MFFFPENGHCNDVWKRDALMFVIISLSNFKTDCQRSSIVLVLGTFDEESLRTKIHRKEVAADRRESITGNLVLTTELKT